MECPTPAKNKAGALLTECALALPLAMGAGAFLAATLALAGARQLLFLDAFSLARAHLYGNARDFCAPSRFWPPLRGLRLEVDCDAQGSVTEYLYWRGIERARAVVVLGRSP